MATNKQVRELEQKIVELKESLQYEKELKLKAEGKIELLENQQSNRRDVMEIRGREFQHEIEWLREVVLLMSVPKEKLEEMEKLRREKIRSY